MVNIKIVAVVVVATKSCLTDLTQDVKSIAIFQVKAVKKIECPKVDIKDTVLSTIPACLNKTKPRDDINIPAAGDC